MAKVDIPPDLTATFKQLSKLLAQAVDRFSHEHPAYSPLTMMDNKIVHECVARASVTLREYNMNGEKLEGKAGDQGHVSAPNHLKEAGHYAYWITKLKPLRLVNFGMIGAVLDRRNISYDKARLNSFNGAREHITVLLNEYAAFFIAAKIIRSSEKQILERKLKEMQTEGVAAERQDASKKEFSDAMHQASLKAGLMSDNILDSLRYDTHSPNSLALLFESLFSTGIARKP
ncbi:MAG TPA: hypothetical protein PKZ99_02155 [Azospirillaceae bacterium]|nr:hypothetical protein [Azospirillaceae bacterium]